MGLPPGCPKEQPFSLPTLQTPPWPSSVAMAVLHTVGKKVWPWSERIKTSGSPSPPKALAAINRQHHQVILTLLISSLSSACIQIGLCSSVWGRTQDSSADHLTLLLCHFHWGSVSCTVQHSVSRASSSPEGSDTASRSPWSQAPRKATREEGRSFPMGEYLC